MSEDAKKQAETYRLQRYRQLQELQLQRNPNTYQNPHDVAQEARAFARVQPHATPPQPEWCPWCWYDHGIESVMEPWSPALASADDETEIERCPSCKRERVDANRGRFHLNNLQKNMMASRAEGCDLP